MNSKTYFRFVSSALCLLFFIQFSLFAQSPIYNFQQVDSLPTFQSCPTQPKSAIEPWIECFFPKVEKMVIDSIESMSQQVGMTFEGTIKVSFVIDEKGNVVSMELKNKPHPILKKAAKDVLINLTNLKPAILNKQAVAVNITLEIEHYPKGKNTIDEQEENVIYEKVTEMPRFPGCEDLNATDEVKKKCADKKMLQFLYRRFKYPAYAREMGIDGTVIIEFIVEKDGSISNIAIKRDIGGGCGDAVAGAVEQMNIEGIKWRPGLLNGKPVRVQFNVPVKFWLE